MLINKLFPLLFFCSTAIAASIADQSNLPLLNPDLSERKTAKMVLPNQLEVLLISDPGADSSAAALSVQVGSWSDPETYPGMAHFCEHMLFRGSVKYPEDNRFTELLSNYAGSHNAFTAADRTVYGFSSQLDGFLNVLDTFSRFFIDPLFNPDAVSKEMHAVDQEFGQNIENDYWREYMVFKETGNQEHPNRLFSVGNSETLGNIPPAELRDWHAKYYSASRMHLVLYSSLPLETLEQAATELFSAVPITDHLALNPDLPLFSQEQKGHILYVEPVQNRRHLSLTWELPKNLSLDFSKPAQLISYALNRGQTKSLYENLKKEGWVDSLSVQASPFGSKEHCFFDISMELTQAGAARIEQVTLRCFEAIAGLKAEAFPQYLFQEKQEVVRLDYQYQTRGNPFRYTLDLASALCDEPLATFPRQSLFADQFDPKKIRQVLSLLKPQDCSLSLMAPPQIMQVTLDRKERWSGVAYTLQPIPPAWITTWSRAKPQPEIAIAPPNPFLPTQLELVADPQFGSAPIAFAQSEFGTAYYARCAEFANPESVYILRILSPALVATTRSAVLGALYLDHLTDILSPITSAAASAGSSLHFAINQCRLELEISGFSEKHSELLQAIASQMPQTPPTPEQFAIYFDRHEKHYQNGERALAATQAYEILSSILHPEESNHREKLAALKTVTYEDLLAFHKALFEKVSFEALFAGNLSLVDAESAWLDIIHLIGKSPYPAKEHPPQQQFRFPQAAGPFSIRQGAPIQGNATLLLLDEGPLTFEKRAAQELLHSVLSEAFFNELRSRQKTGYINQSRDLEVEEHLYAFFLVQSTTYSPEELLYRFEHFLEDFNGELSEKIPQSRFDTLKVSLADALKNRCRNLRDKASLWATLAFHHHADFAFVEKRIAAYQTLTYDEFLRTANSYLSRGNRRRVAILVEGKLGASFAYEAIETPQLKEVVTAEPPVGEN